MKFPTSLAEKAAYGVALLVTIAFAAVVVWGLFTPLAPSHRGSEAWHPTMDRAPSTSSDARASLPGTAKTDLTPGEAAAKTQIAHLMTLLRGSALSGDRATARALVIGLSKHGPAAKGILQRACADEPDARVRTAYQDAIKAIDGGSS